MGLCKCPKRKVTNLFCFEHDVNVCEYCLVSDHERCIVQSYVQWLQDSDYNPICILCRNLLKDEPTVRLVCLDVFHWSCLNKYASELPGDTAPAGYQCPKCKECIFPPPNLVSPVVDMLRKKLETVSWSRVGLGQSPLVANSGGGNEESPTRPLLAASTSTNSADDESNGFVIVSQQNKDKPTATSVNYSSQQQAITSPQLLSQTTNSSSLVDTATTASKISQQQQKLLTNKVKSDINSPIPQQSSKFEFEQTNRSKFDARDLDTITPVYHNRVAGHIVSNQEQTYDPSLGIVLSIDKLEDRDTGENKYKRRPLLEWLQRFLRSRQMTSRRLRMTRQKKILFLVIFFLIALFTLILIMSRLGEYRTENDPALDPMNNPNIRVQVQ
uniref:Predicted protein n=1 Tax=Hordeum vulgare subsp. vulgare TaxID=112509 RepID=F2DNF3_HORVV|nr:predicted protein [Hordeum vulgare subsp. vulgare]